MSQFKYDREFELATRVRRGAKYVVSLPPQKSLLPAGDSREGAGGSLGWPGEALPRRLATRLKPLSQHRDCNS